jgi:hypothetical protein
MLALAAATLVVCAPGYPGSSAEAQPAMEALAGSLSRAAHLPPGSLTAVYEETEAGGLKRLAEKDASLLLAPLPFYLEHEQGLRLRPRLSAVPREGEPVERWTLVTGKDHPPVLEGYTVLSSAGYSQRFVRAAAPVLPKQVAIRQDTSVLSSLRRAANGEKVAVLLDGAQTAALAKLPFAASLATVSTSPPMPVALVATVAKRIEERRWKDLEAAFRKLADDPAGREALEGVRMRGFVALDERALAAARSVWRRAR